MRDFNLPPMAIVHIVGLICKGSDKNLIYMNMLVTHNHFVWDSF